LALPVLIIWRELTGKTMQTISVKKLRIPLSSINEGAQKFNGVIVTKEGDNLIALSSACTHLGCNVNLIGNKIVCPCHGSQYNLDGVVERGPAVKNLKILKIIKHKKELIITERS